MPGLSLISSIDPLEAAVFVFGLLLALMIARTIKGRQAPRRRRATAAGNRSWMPAAIALALLLAVWLYLSF
jgi:hypothetical protein